LVFRRTRIHPMGGRVCGGLSSTFTGPLGWDRWRGRRARGLGLLHGTGREGGVRAPRLRYGCRARTTDAKGKPSGTIIQGNRMWGEIGLGDAWRLCVPFQLVRAVGRRVSKRGTEPSKRILYAFDTAFLKVKAENWGPAPGSGGEGKRTTGEKRENNPGRPKGT